MIRKMALGDIEQVSEIEKECFKDPWSKSEFEYLFNFRDSLAVVYEGKESVSSYRGSRVFKGEGVSHLPLKIVGYGLAISFHPCLHIVNLAVKPIYRMKGIGSALVSYILDYARKKNKNLAILEVRIHNLSAINLYKKFGFKETEVKNSYYPDGEDATVMRMKLNT